MQIEIRQVEPEELEAVVRLFKEQVYVDDPSDAEEHFADHAAGDGTTFLAMVDGEFAGHLTIRWRPRSPSLRAQGLPLIQDLNVFSQFQRRGIATRLMDAAERLIATRFDTAVIVVGLFDAYGPAQRLYARRGYVPDGRGACQGNRPLQRGETVVIDHDLILWLTKDLSPEP